MTEKASTVREESAHDHELFRQLLEEEDYTYQPPTRGQFLTGTVVDIRPEVIAVDIGVKRDGLVPASDFKVLADDIIDDIKPGDEVPVYVVRPWNADGDLILSMARGLEKEDWQKAHQLYEQEAIIQVTIVDHNKGGLVAYLGHARGFIPASHVEGLPRFSHRSEQVEALQHFVDQTLPVQIIEISETRNRLIFSHRQAMKVSRQRRKSELIANLDVGDVIPAEVVSFAKFGVFVDIGGAHGLIHSSELAAEPVQDPSALFDIGEQVQVYVLRLDPERQRIDLSIRRLLPDPWQDVEAQYREGEVLAVKITRIVDFGAFAELKPGVQGLIHISQIANHHVEHPSSIVSVNDEVMARIRSIDVQRRRISLSMRDVAQWEVREEPTPVTSSPSVS